MKKPKWYSQTSPDPDYPGIDKNIQNLIYLLRNNGWNTVSSCGHEYRGVVTIDCYEEQSGGMVTEGGEAECLRKFLAGLGYQHFEIKQTIFQWHGYKIENILTLKLLGADYLERGK